MIGNFVDIAMLGFTLFSPTNHLINLRLFETGTYVEIMGSDISRFCAGWLVRTGPAPRRS